ncbi:growth arrest-specific protein 1 [Microcaecilia unicolor]|uniref:Growth arrest-specific protein 1 n=1 Tax=Microcaecilia unicolor TaxID=1415580 RepID=A0A6P7X1V8_9AMPH|nr:growth arrest-specific protein 1 [Microcaecilia unicolor]
MRRGGGGSRVTARSPRDRFPQPLPLLLVAVAALSSPVQSRRLICWQAVLQCQREPECSYAYNQYGEACAPVLLSPDEPQARRRCPSHCISALIQLNHTRGGPALEECDCAQDETCRATKRAIEPCLPRTSSAGAAAGGDSSFPGGGGGVLGCTEARRRCDRDRRCGLALVQYLSRCGKLFDGLRCTAECRAVIQHMLAVPKALPLSDCVCDGLERPICESVKENMARLCFAPELSGGTEYDLYDEEYEEILDEEQQEPGGQPVADGAGDRVGTGGGGGNDAGSGASGCLGPGSARVLALCLALALLLRL